MALVFQYGSNTSSSEMNGEDRLRGARDWQFTCCSQQHSPTIRNQLFIHTSVAQRFQHGIKHWIFHDALLDCPLIVRKTNHSAGARAPREALDRGNRARPAARGDARLQEDRQRRDFVETLCRHAYSGKRRQDRRRSFEDRRPSRGRRWCSDPQSDPHALAVARGD